MFELLLKLLVPIIIEVIRIIFGRSASAEHKAAARENVATVLKGAHEELKSVRSECLGVGCPMDLKRD